jgi:hypothetical protein
MAGPVRTKTPPPLVQGLALTIQHSQMKPSTSAALLIPHEKLRSSRQYYYFNERMGAALQLEPDFGKLQYRLHPILLMHRITQREGNQTILIVQFPREFAYQPTRVKAELDNRLEAPNIRDRHMAVDGNTGRKIFALLRRRIFHFNHPRIV